ncbi:hypothetical protein TRIUR3_09836 [Triticum urartu]|uniref:Uncharacterized protein n=2 Tax=Triticum TaxID=4564 RepID=M7ZYE9_TRIUA|nr:uncharacterized protein LOC119269313 [Triticum dicoccoides]XP_048564897.1 uncharacterized protein LOC125545081 [Triticum urartu]EMS68213.1 hypothetical protein TRIUR3_09836 [Triticum urartu]VAH65062.1 unnamed protein product [Triticum turgidum subsp. durum]
MAPAALSAPVLRVSPQSAGRAAAAAPAGGLRFGQTACLHSGHSGQTVLRSKVLLQRPVGQRRRSALRSSVDDSKATDDKVEFGYSRKDVLLIGVGVTLLGYGLKSGLEFVGVDPLQAGNVVQLFIVLGMTVGWISSYMIRVANKDMTYATQLRNYEKQVMEKRLESLSEAELQVLLEQVEEEKERLPPMRRDQGITINRKTEDQTTAN